MSDMLNYLYRGGGAAQLPDTERSQQQNSCNSTSEIFYIILAE